MTTSCDTGCKPSKIKVGDIGTEILVDLCSDISLAVAAKLFVLKPGGVYPADMIEWSAGVYQTRYLRHVTVAGDLNVDGEYKIEGWVQMPDGQWTTDTGTFRVYPRFG